MARFGKEHEHKIRVLVKKDGRRIVQEKLLVLNEKNHWYEEKWFNVPVVYEEEINEEN